MPVPISQYVLKVHGRCNLACDHCYVYEHTDQSWRSKPAAIRPETVGIAARRIAEHAVAHKLTEVSVILHGGEPLLLGKSAMHALLDALISPVGRVTGVDIRVHSNGVLLDQQWCDLFREYGVKVGVSLDGDRAANDRHRRFADDRSSFEQVRAGLALLRQPKYRALYAGILCTIDLANDPIAVYEALVAEEPPRLDLLLPHATWEHPPYRPPGCDSPYADWLMRVFQRWDRDGRVVPIRFFDSLLSAANGGPSFTEALGTDPANLLVIETDGSWEQADSLKVTFDGAPATDRSVFRHSVDEAARHPAFAAQQQGVAALCPTCRACPVVRICGGGLYAHRYRARSPAGAADRLPALDQFSNPSVYCADLKALIRQATTAMRPRAAQVFVRADMYSAPARSSSRPRHQLSAGAFDLLAAGPGSIEAVGALAMMRLSQARSLVARVIQQDYGWRDTNLHAAAAEGWALLCALDREHHDAVQEMFSHPYTYAWAVHCLRSPVGSDTDLDRAHLAGLAAAAAVRAGVSAELPLAVRDGMLFVPATGALKVTAGTGRTKAVTIRQGRNLAADTGAVWQEARSVTGPLFPRLAVEDLDPFRDCQQWPATARLTEPEWLSWQRGLTTAGQHLIEVVPSYARSLGAGLRTVVPLRPTATGSRSATSRQAFGAVATVLPRAAALPGELAELLLHEFQHVKLNALLDLHVLFDAAYSPRIRVPWRDDVRPLGGALQGAYAYLALTHLRRSEGSTARAQYFQYRAWVCGVADTLVATGALTEHGEHFVAGMAAAAEDAG
jgi:uncharacterized protein